MLMGKLRIAVIISSTRDTRFGPIAAEWMAGVARERDDLEIELVDLRDFDLPFFNEKMSNRAMPSEDPRAVAWQKKIGEFDGYIVAMAEYNRSVTGAMKNAFDQAYVEWNRKPIGFVGYGSVGGAFAIQNARVIAVELQMVPVRAAVHIGGSEYVKVVHQRQPMTEIEPAILPSANDLLDEIIWWGNATKAARSKA